MNDVISIPFTEALSSTNDGLYAQDLVLVDKDNKTLVAGIDYSTAVSGSNLVVTLLGNYATAYNGPISVGSKSTITYVKDANGVKANAFSAKSVSYAADVTAPTATVAIGGTDDDLVTAQDTITITFSEATDKPVLADADFAISNDHTLDLATNGSAVWNAAGTVLTLTLGDAPTLTAADTIAFKLVDTIEDVAGNDFGNASIYTVPTLAGSAW